MTIDGGPSTSTLNIQSGLKTSGLKATFHVDPTWIHLPASSTNTQGLKTDGHVIGMRFPSSVDPTTLSPQELRDKLKEYAEKMKEHVEVLPKFIRFDAGKVNQQVLETASQMGFVATSFNIDSRDYEKPSQDTMVVNYQNQWNQVSNGKGSYISIHLDTDTEVYAGEPGVQFFTKVRDAAKQKGYTFTTLDDCFATSPYLEKLNDAGSPSPPPSGGTPPPPPPGGNLKNDASTLGASALLSLAVGAATAWFA